MKSSKSNNKISVATNFFEAFCYDISTNVHYLQLLTNRQRPLKTLPIFMIPIKACYYRAYEANIFSNWQITSLLVVGGLYTSTRQNGDIFGGHPCAAKRASGWLVGLVRDISARERGAVSMAQYHYSRSPLHCFIQFSRALSE